jgi:glycogen(starch) synthase
MRVLMTTDAVGGVWTYSLDLARALQPHGIHITLAVMGPPPSPDQRAEAEAIGGVALHVGGYKLEWMEDPWEDLDAAGDWLLDLESRVRPDVVHLNGLVHGALDWRAPCLVAGHSCVLSWWRSVRAEEAPDSWNRYRDAVCRGLRAADMVVAPSTFMLASLNRDYGPLPERRVLFNGRPPELFSAAPKEELVLSCGRLWDEAKNVAALDAIAPDLPWPVYIAGDSAGAAPFQNGRSLGMLSSRELADWMARAAIYALPVRYEPFGLSVLEAAFSGCALVLGDVPSLREIWDDAALFVRPEDHAGLRNAILTLIHDPSMRRRFAKLASERARCYTADRMARGYRDTYDHLMNTGAPMAAR